MDAKTRAWWSAKQGLDGSMPGASAGAVLERTGWARSVGGSNGYTTLFARAGTKRLQAESAAERLEIAELLSARGCTYHLGAADFAIGLAVGRAAAEASIEGAKRTLGVTEEEIAHLCDGVLAALQSGPKDPAQLKSELGGRVRDLGEEGKRRGQANTLPNALTRLQSLGRIRKTPTNGRFDSQRFAYVAWDGLGEPMDPDDAHRALAERYFRWIGPASIENYRWFTGLGVGAAKQTLAGLPLVPIADGSPYLLLVDELDAFREFEAPAEEQITLVSALDAVFLLRRNVADHLDPTDAGRQVAGERGLTTIGPQDLANNAILDRGRVIGLWEFDPEAGEIVWTTFDNPSQAVRQAVAETEAFIHDQLGDARSFSLDSPKSRAPKLELLRQMSARP